MKKAGWASALVAVILLAVAVIAEAQQPKNIPRIGILADVPAPQHSALQQGLRDLGYIEGENILIERRYAKGERERLPGLAAELVSLKVDVIVSLGPATPFAAKSVKSIPVVMAYSGDPVDAGIVASLARPGGNVTGMSFFAAVLAGKRLELLKETIPKISRVAVLANPGHAGEQLELKETQAAARAFNVALQYLTVRAPDDFTEAFRLISKERAEGIIAFPDNHVDVALSFTVLEEGNADRMLRELVRVTKPGGRVAVMVRAIDIPLVVNIPLSPELKAKTQIPRGFVGSEGCADASLYKRFQQLGLADTQMWPQFAASQQSDTPQAQFAHGAILGALTIDEVKEWRAGMAQAVSDGTYFIAQPFHCAVGTKPATPP
jgi:ABC-type uncharacterized transport system substrate-binding protein